MFRHLLFFNTCSGEGSEGRGLKVDAQDAEDIVEAYACFDVGYSSLWGGGFVGEAEEAGGTQLISVCQD
jgi:hypothetical protein